MRTLRLLLIGLIPALLAADGPDAPGDKSPADSKPVKVAFLGDQGVTKNSKAVLKLVKAENAELLVHLGDLDYTDDPDAWEKMIVRYLGDDFPVLVALGNHDVKKMQGYLGKIQARFKKIKGITCDGALGIQAACAWRGLSLIFMTPGLNQMDHAGFAKEKLAQSKARWKICAWHIPHTLMQIELRDADYIGLKIYDACREEGALIATGHSHTYSRTHLMENFETQKVASTVGPIKIEKNKTLAFVAGLGGESIRPRFKSGQWWAVALGLQDKVSYGALFCDFRQDGQPEKASCYYKDIQGRVWDRFDLVAQEQKHR